METAVVRGRVDYEVDPPVIHLDVYVVRSGSGRLVQGSSLSMEVEEITLADITDWLDLALPDNSPA